jgi:hypothetical protein
MLGRWARISTLTSALEETRDIAQAGAFITS